METKMEHLKMKKKKKRINKRNDTKRDQEEHFVMIKPVIHHEDIKFLIYSSHIHKEEAIVFARKNVKKC